jgi:hypothetical protein
MLADLVLTPTFPGDELEREREVLLHEFTEDEDDPLSTAFKLFDKGCWGTHPVAQPVIGTRRNLERFTRDDLVQWVRALHGRTHGGRRGRPGRPRRGAARRCRRPSAPCRAAPPNGAGQPAWHGGVHSKRLDGCSQSHLVLGFPVPPARPTTPPPAWPPRCWARA